MVALKLGTISICIELKVRQFTAIRLNCILVFAVILLAPSDLDADSMLLEGRPFQKCCWLFDQRTIMQIN